MELLAYLEDSAFSEWVLLSMLGFPTLIALHSVGMAVAVGLSLMVTLYFFRVLSDLNAQLIASFLGIAVCGFSLNLVTGLALFVTRGREYIGSGIFLTKMLLVLVSTVILFWLWQRLKRRALTTELLVADGPAKTLSLISTVTWIGAVVAGRLIAYLSGMY